MHMSKESVQFETAHLKIVIDILIEIDNKNPIQGTPQRLENKYIANMVTKSETEGIMSIPGIPKKYTNGIDIIGYKIRGAITGHAGLFAGSRSSGFTIFNLVPCFKYQSETIFAAEKSEFPSIMRVRIV
jgi:hypothetical protein